jgi:RND family efflux transporter MFP subunit
MISKSILITIMKRITILTVLIAATLGAGSTSLISCASKSSADSTAKPTQETVTVQTSTVTLQPIASTLKVTGSLEGTREATVQSETQGRILSVVHTIGDRVSDGTPLVKVDDELKVIAVQQATAQRLSAEATLEKAKLDDQRNQDLFKQNAITKNQVELSQLQVKSAEANLKAAASGESLAKRQLSDATVKAPFGGVVSARFVNQGETLSPGTKVETIVDDSRMKFRMFINELEVVNLKVGDPVTVTVDAISGKTFDGKITNMSDKSDQTRSYEVDVELPNPDHAVKSGMFARAEIQREAAHDVASIPIEGIVYNGTATQAYVVENGVAHLRTIKLGATTQTLAEVIDGLKPGDEVVTFGQNQMHDGVRVRK